MENTSGVDIAVYPNPASERITIDLRKKYEIVSVEITDVHGKFTQRESFDNRQLLTLELDDQAGVYLVRVDIGGASITHRIIQE